MFYYHIMRRLIHKWLAIKDCTLVDGKVKKAMGPGAIQQVAKMLNPATPAFLVTMKCRTGGNMAKQRRSTSSKQHMVSTSWLVAYVLAPTANRHMSKVVNKAVAVFDAIVSSVFRGRIVSVVHS